MFYLSVFLSLCNLGIYLYNKLQNAAIGVVWKDMWTDALEISFLTNSW